MSVFNNGPEFRAIARKQEQLAIAMDTMQDVAESYENEWFPMGEEPLDIVVSERRVARLRLELQQLRDDAGIVGSVRLISEA